MAVVDTQREGKIYEIDLKEPEKRGVTISLPSEAAWGSTEERQRRIDFYWLKRFESEEPELTYAIFEEEEGKERRVIGWYDSLAGKRHEDGSFISIPKVNRSNWIPREWAMLWNWVRDEFRRLGKKLPESDMPSGVAFGWLPADRGKEFNPEIRINDDSTAKLIAAFVDKANEIIKDNPDVFDDPYVLACLSAIETIRIVPETPEYWAMAAGRDVLIVSSGVKSIEEAINNNDLSLLSFYTTVLVHEGGHMLQGMSFWTTDRAKIELPMYILNLSLVCRLLTHDQYQNDPLLKGFRSFLFDVITELDFAKARKEIFLV